MSSHGILYPLSSRKRSQSNSLSSPQCHPALPLCSKYLFLTHFQPARMHSLRTRPPRTRCQHVICFPVNSLLQIHHVFTVAASPAKHGYRPPLTCTLRTKYNNISSCSTAPQPCGYHPNLASKKSNKITIDLQRQYFSYQTTCRVPSRQCTAFTEKGISVTVNYG